MNLQNVTGTVTPEEIRLTCTIMERERKRHKKREKKKTMCESERDKERQGTRNR